MAVVTATRRDTKLHRLARHRLLAGCNPAEIVRVARVFDEIEVPAGGVVLQTSPLARWFVLIDDGDAGGDFCGAEALLLHSPQWSTVTATTHVRAFIAPGRDLVGLVSDIPALARGPLGALAASTPAPPRALRPRPSAAPVSRPLPARPFCADLSGSRPSKSAQKVSARFWVSVVGVIGALVFAAGSYHPPVLLLSPGDPVDISNDVTISGVPVYPVHGRYLMTPVRLRRPSLLKLGLAGLSGGAQVISLRSGPDHDAIRKAGRAAFDSSRVAATTAALAGTPPRFTIQFRARNIVGPSAGLAYALLIHDLLSPDDVSDGRVIAATGTIDAGGMVGPVGSVAEKLAGARHAHAGLMLLPLGQLGEASDAHITVMGVSSLDEAVAALAR